jgi:NADH-quinone oxidoreductase subunit G
VAEDHQLVFLDRGDHTFVGTHDGRPYVAPFSGNIIELCPVGALTSTAYRFRARPWDIEDSGTICTLCPSQCNVKLTIRDDAKVVRVLARDNEEVDDGWLCDKGRFGYQSFGAPERITAPLMRIGGFLRETSWERALAEAASALERSGENTVARVGGQATNEEGFLVQHLLRKGLGSPHVSAAGSAGAAPARVGGGGGSGILARALARVDLAARVSDIDHADAILVLDTELVDEAPILDLRVRKAVRRNQARLVVASSRPSTLDSGARAALRFAPGAAEAALAALAAALGSERTSDASLDELASRAGATMGFIPGRPQPTGANGAGPAAAGNGAGAAPAGAADAVRAAAELLRYAGDVVVICGERAFGSERGAQAGEALLAVAAALGIPDRAESGLIPIPAGTNGRGLREVGCSSTLEPGLADAGTPGDPDSARGALVLLETDASEAEMARASSVIAFARFHSEALDSQADVVFPAEIYAEKEGTVTHPDGRVQRVRQALGRPNEVRAGWSVIAELCDRVGASTGALSASMVTAQIADAVPFYAGLTLDEIGGDGVRWQDRDAASALPAAELSTEALADPPEPHDGLVLAVAPTLWTGPEVEYSPSLRFLATGEKAWLSVEDARRLGVESGDEVELSVDGESLSATAVVRTAVPAGSVFLSPPALAEGPVEVRAPQAVAS